MPNVFLREASRSAPPGQGMTSEVAHTSRVRIGAGHHKIGLVLLLGLGFQGEPNNKPRA